MLTRLIVFTCTSLALLWSAPAQDHAPAAAPVILHAEGARWFGSAQQHVAPIFGPIGEGREQHAYVYLGHTTPRFCIGLMLKPSHTGGVKLTQVQAAKAVTLVGVYHQETKTVLKPDKYPPVTIALVSRQQQVEQATLDRATPVAFLHGTVGTADNPWQEGVYRLSVRVDLEALGLTLANAAAPRQGKGINLMPEPRHKKTAAILVR